MGEKSYFGGLFRRVFDAVIVTIVVGVLGFGLGVTSGYVFGSGIGTEKGKRDKITEIETQFSEFIKSGVLPANEELSTFFRAQIDDFNQGLELRVANVCGDQTASEYRRGISEGMRDGRIEAKVELENTCLSRIAEVEDTMQIQVAELESDWQKRTSEIESRFNGVIEVLESDGFFWRGFTQQVTAFASDFPKTENEIRAEAISIISSAKRARRAAETLRGVLNGEIDKMEQALEVGDLNEIQVIAHALASSLESKYGEWQRGYRSIVLDDDT